MNDRTWRASGMVLVLSAAACGEPTATVRTGFPATNDQAFAVRSWVTLTPDAVAREWPSAANVGEQFYVMGGWTGSAISSDLSVFDPVSGSWTQRAPMPVPVYSSLGAQGLSGQLMVIAGEASSGVPGTTVSVYDPSSNSWTTTTPFPVAAGCGGSGVIAGTLYALTGCEVQYSSYTGSLYSYNPQTHQWTARAANPIPRQFPAVAAAGGKLYAVGGILSNARTSGDLTVFSPSSGTWQTKASIPVPRYGAVAVAYGPKLVVFGGIDFNGNALADVWLYDPTANVWTQVPTTGFVARGNLAGAVAAGAAYAVGGLLVHSGSGTVANTLQRILP